MSCTAACAADAAACTAAAVAAVAAVAAAAAVEAGAAVGAFVVVRAGVAAVVYSNHYNQKCGTYDAGFPLACHGAPLHLDVQ